MYKIEFFGSSGKLVKTGSPSIEANTFYAISILDFNGKLKKIAF